MTTGRINQVAPMGLQPSLAPPPAVRRRVLHRRGRPSGRGRLPEGAPARLCPLSSDRSVGASAPAGIFVSAAAPPLPPAPSPDRSRTCGSRIHRASRSSRPCGSRSLPGVPFSPSAASLYASSRRNPAGGRRSPSPVRGRTVRRFGPPVGPVAGRRWGAGSARASVRVGGRGSSWVDAGDRAREDCEECVPCADRPCGLSDRLG